MATNQPPAQPSRLDPAQRVAVTSAGHFPQQVQIDAYGNSGFRFADMSHRGSLLALPSGMYAWSVTDASALGAGDFAAIGREDPRPELVLVGTGTQLLPLKSELRFVFSTFGASVEAMATGSAARTYNILLGEGRRVAAALIAVN